MAFPAQDFAPYLWRQSDAEPGVFVRRGAGGEAFEDFCNRAIYGEQNLFLGVHLKLAKPVDAAVLLRAFRSAWISLRFVIPTLALETKQDAADNTLLVYKVAKDLADVTLWAERTAQLVETSTDLDEIRANACTRTLPDAAGDQTFIYLVPQASTTEYGVLLQTHHTPFDGGATKIVMTRFLEILSTYIDNEALAQKHVSSLSWGKETDNLLPAYTKVVASTEPLSGPAYDQTLGAIMGGFGHHLPRQHGYKKRGEGLGVSRRIEHKFSKEESERIVASARASGFTVNHIVHAAAYLSALHDNPDVKDDASFFVFGLADCRGRLAPPYNEPLGYPGYCLGISGVAVPLSQVKGEDRKAQLRSIAEVIKVEYAAQKAHPALLGVVAQEVELFLHHVKTGPPPAPWMGPWYAGDGIGERYLHPVYKDAEGKDAITITDYFTSLKQVQPGPYVRSYSWGGSLTISLDFNDAAMPLADCEGILQDIIQSIRTIV
ncbi:hypothetical protein EXIGLDRAFT_724036 [Exidia glandulosa HHB12029]|uniref:CoA-dependent acyltransferase n=1 Tax=Exidia glandulosa HHB12029 TaxID=1314781 RepID=A0A165EKE4_EXIGL|nr:hypothetical protein EXIGLDRAFT_724036 [Exidia glandulosa HHB12029]